MEKIDRRRREHRQHRRSKSIVVSKGTRRPRNDHSSKDSNNILIKTKHFKGFKGHEKEKKRQNDCEPSMRNLDIGRWPPRALLRNKCYQYCTTQYNRLVI